MSSYDKKIVLFLDILGFSELLNEDDGLKKLVGQVNILKKLFQYDQGEYKRGGEIVQFSDCIVVSSRIKNPQELERFFYRVADTVLTMHSAGILTRGAITFGNHYYRDDVLVSPAMARAYKLESGVARFPRVVVAPEFEKSLRESVDWDANWFVNHPFSRQVYLDYDGVLVLNYLRIKVFEDPETEEQKVRARILNNHRMVLEDYFEHNQERKDINLSEKFKIYQKLSWLASYHNSIVDNYTDLDEQQKSGLRVWNPTHEERFGSMAVPVSNQS